MSSNKPQQPADVDPLLVRLARDVYEAAARGRAKGVTITPAEQDAYIREESNGRYGISDARALLRGDASLIDLAKQLHAKTAQLRAAGEEVTAEHQERFLRAQSNGRYGLEDAASALRGVTAPRSQRTGDPTFVRAARDVVTATERARKGGQMLTPDDFEGYVREETGGRYGYDDVREYLKTINPSINARNLGRSFAQGALMNWGDEGLDVLTSPEIRESLSNTIPGAQWLGPAGAAIERLFGRRAGEEMRLRADLFNAAHPAADAAAGIGGAVATGLVLPGTGAATMSKALLKGAAIGAGSGALSGAGAGESSDDRAKRAAIGAAAGGTLGATLPGLAASARYFSSPSTRATSRLGHAVQQSGGVDKLRAAASDVASAGRGADVMLADLSPHLRQAADFAANSDDNTLVGLAERLRRRQADASNRLLEDVRSGFPGETHADAARTSLEASRRAWAAGPNGFGGLRANNTAVDGRALADVLKQPKVSKALADAHEAGLIGRTPTSKELLTYEKLQAVKEDLDDAVTAAFRNGRGNLGARLAEARDMIVEHLHTTVPGYADATAEYARRMGLERALTAGEEAWGQLDSRGLASQVASMSAEELQHFRTGLASELVAKLRGAATNRDQAKQLVDASASLEDKLRVVFGDQPTFEQFMKRVGTEAELAKLRGTVGGSSTARRLQAQGFDPAEIGVSMALHGPTAGLWSAARAMIGKSVTGAVARGTARELGPMLMTQGTPAIGALLQQLKTRPDVLSAPGLRGLSTGASRVPSLFDF